MAKENNQSNESEDEKPNYRKKTLSVAQETIVTADELVNGVKNTKDPVKESYGTVATLLKSLNGNKNVSLTTFKGYFNQFIESGDVGEENEMINNILNSMFILLKDNIEKDKIIAMNSRESANSLIESLILTIKRKQSDLSIPDIVGEFNEKAISKTNMGKVIEYADKWDSLLGELYKA